MDRRQPPLLIGRGLTESLAGRFETLHMPHWRSAGVLTGLPKYAGDTARRRGSSPKFQVFNTALITAQSGMNQTEAFADREFWGRLTESAVGAHLLNASIGGACELFYWRERNREVDFVVRRGKKLVAIKVKSGRTTTSLPGMESFAKSFKPDRRLIVGTGGISLELFLSKPVGYWINQADCA